MNTDKIYANKLILDIKAITILVIFAGFLIQLSNLLRAFDLLDVNVEYS